MQHLNEELTEVKRLRKKHSLTQAQLAKLAGVSQSLIAKIEAGRIDPTFSNAKKIFEAIHSINAQQEPKAGQLITHRIISVSQNEPVSEAVRKMKANSISQLPVTDSGGVVGLISESNIIEKAVSGKNPAALKVKDFMEDAPPLVSKAMPLTAVTELLKHSPLVIVAENGKPTGVITKSDVLRKLM